MKQKIIDGNKLIAAFMGDTVVREIVLEDETLETIWVTRFGVRYELNYHDSWDWLMPVIVNIGDENILDFNIDNSWRRVVEHIKWHNKQK